MYSLFCELTVSATTSPTITAPPCGSAITPLMLPAAGSMRVSWRAPSGAISTAIMREITVIVPSPESTVATGFIRSASSPSGQTETDERSENGSRGQAQVPGQVTRSFERGLARSCGSAYAAVAPSSAIAGSAQRSPGAMICCVPTGGTRQPHPVSPSRSAVRPSRFASGRPSRSRTSRLRMTPIATAPISISATPRASASATTARSSKTPITASPGSSTCL